MPSSRPKPAEVASAAKRQYIPHIQKYYQSKWPASSYLVPQPLAELAWKFSSEQLSPAPPDFHISPGDPVDFALRWQEHLQLHPKIPVICAANDKRPGGDWETGVGGYEERLCRRSSLSATLGTPMANTYPSNYPIPSEGAIYSQEVVIFRGPPDHYKELDETGWKSLPIISVPAVRWPKLSQGGGKYAFEVERELMRDKIRGALRLCNWEFHDYVVIGDFGLGNGLRNPPRELAEMWRDIFLYDPDIRGYFKHVAFVFEDVQQSTTNLIIDELSKKSKSGHSSGGSGSKSKSRSSHGSSATSATSSSGTAYPTDFEIFQQVFDPVQIQDVLTRPDPRYGISMLTS